MRIEVTYYAEDGKEFSSEEECRAYEREKMASFDSVMFFDDNFAWHKQPDIPFVESDAVYFKVVDASKAEILFDWLGELCGACFPEEPLKEGHIYVYDSEDPANDNYWVDYTKRLEETQKVVARIEEEIRARS